MRGARVGDSHARDRAFVGIPLHESPRERGPPRTRLRGSSSDSSAKLATDVVSQTDNKTVSRGGPHVTSPEKSNLRSFAPLGFSSPRHSHYLQDKSHA